eukprot:Nitzschia sp. Nitz4//scaffold60_size111251//36487//38209//NITZ4_004143-RA/size111251-processed-gene-0.22-mRNA-1//1//CDS//3329555552//5326//frame0
MAGNSPSDFNDDDLQSLASSLEPSLDGLEIELPFGSIDEPLEKSLERLRLDHVDQVVARDLNQLNSEQREKILHDIHGIFGNDVYNDPPQQVVSDKVNELLQILGNRSKQNRAHGYSLAVSIKPSYVHNNNFLCMFLRTDDWNPERAANRIVLHFDVKLSIYGSELLCKDVTQDDLTPGALEALYSGYIQDLPIRDTAGRVVSVGFPHVFKDHPSITTKDKISRMFYVSTGRSKDFETRVKGRVLVAWLLDGYVAPNHSEAMELMKIPKALPQKVSAFHLCVVGGKQSTFQNSLLALFFYGLETILRFRTKVHFVLRVHIQSKTGTPAEIKNKLRSFGIPSSLLPVTNDGEMVLEYGNQMWQDVRKQEQQLHPRNPTERSDSERMTPEVVTEPGHSKSLSERTSTGNAPEVPHVNSSSLHSEELVILPSSNDVLLGRGRLSQEHRGNIQFRYLIELNREKYDQATKTEKVRIASDLVTLIQSRSGRFLKADGSMWSEIEDDTARRKVANCFRTMRRKVKASNGHLSL